MEKGDKSCRTANLSNKPFLMSTQIDNSFDDSYFLQKIPGLTHEAIDEFQRITRSLFIVNSCFALAIPIELSLLLTSFFGIMLSSLFLTIFSYVLVLFYFQAKKPEQLNSIKNRFVSSCRELTENSLSIAAAVTSLASYFGEKVSTPRLFRRWVRQDLVRIKELLLHAALEEQIKQVRLTPTDLEVHASLASTYLACSKVDLALEEFKIMNDYAPNDPWVHEQLAKGYHELGMVQEEMKEMEILVKLRPHDREVMIQLGILYFEHGYPSRGLRIYEELKQINYKKAEDLIAYYGVSRI